MERRTYLREGKVKLNCKILNSKYNQNNEKEETRIEERREKDIMEKKYEQITGEQLPESETNTGY